jgi:hypothetical protein
MPESLVFPYVSIGTGSDDIMPRPFLPLVLGHQNQLKAVNGLLDTGADVNVIPFQIGLELGFHWEEARTGLQLSSNLRNYETRAVLVDGRVGNFPPVRLAFAWTRFEQCPVILGQINFFAEFDVCFFKSRHESQIIIFHSAGADPAHGTLCRVPNGDECAVVAARGGGGNGTIEREAARTRIYTLIIPSKFCRDPLRPESRDDYAQRRDDSGAG